MTQIDAISKNIKIIEDFANQTDQSILIEALTNLEVASSTSVGLQAISFNQKSLGNSLLVELVKGVNNTQEMIDKMCLVLGRVGLDTLSLHEITLALESGNHPVIKLALSLVERNEADVQKQIITQPTLSLLSRIVDLLGSESVDIFKLSNSILVKIGANPNVDQTFYNWLSTELSACFANPKISLRAYQLIADLATISPHTFHYCEKASLLGFATDFGVDSFSGDILASNAVVELFIDISSLSNGALFLQSTQVLDKIATILANGGREDGDPFAKYILLAAIKFWGLFSFNQADLFEQTEPRYAVFKSMTEILKSDDFPVKDAVLVSVANIASTPHGLLLLAQEKMFLQTVVEIIPSATGDLKVSALRSLSCLLSHGNVPECLQISHDMFKSLGRNPMTLLKSWAKSSIPEVSIAALSVLKELAGFEWGIEALANASDVCEFLMDKNDSENVIKEWKYSIVQKLVLDQRAGNIFAPSVYGKMVEGAKAGPFKTEFAPVVAYSLL